jgi:transposase InsO family protein
MSLLPLQFLLLTIGGWMTRDQQKVVAYLLAENEVLREQLRGKRIRFSDAQRRRLARAGKALGRKGLSRLNTLVTPETLLRWYRRLIAKKYDGSGVRGPAVRRRTADVVELIVRIAQENPSWGYTRIRGALSNLGHEVGRNTIKRILVEAGIDPAPERGKAMSWSAFLRAHWGAIAAMDFFTVEVLTLVGLVRYHVLFVIDLASRRVHVAGIVREPYDEWMRQIARNLTDALDGFLLPHRYLIMDRAPVFTHGLRALLAGSGVKSVRLPARSPNLNAYAERFVRSIRDECLSKVVPLGERHLRELVHEFVAHYHGERNHQGLGNGLIEPSNDNAAATRPILRCKRLGGLLNFYYRAVA